MNFFQRNKLYGAAAALPLLLLLSACGSGPTVFSGQNGLQIVGVNPAAPTPISQRRVEVLDNKIRINEKIYFEFDKAVIKAESYGVLREVAEVMKENPYIKRILVEGHASLEKDTPAARAHNMALSSKRAQAVAFYIKNQGVEEGRLESKGFGADNPLESNDTDEGREKNRRVEFTIVEQDAPPSK